MDDRRSADPCYRCWWRLRRRGLRPPDAKLILTLWAFWTLFVDAACTEQALNAQPWITRVQCRVKCLEHFQLTLIEERESVKKSASLGETLREILDIPEEMFQACIQDDNCHSCLQPCWNEPFEYKRCSQICENSKSKQPCINSCQFLSNTSRVSMPPSSDSGNGCDDEEDAANPRLQVDRTLEQAKIACNRHKTTVPEYQEYAANKDLKCLDIEEVNVTEAWEMMGASLQWKVKHRHHHQQAKGDHHHRLRHYRSPILYVVQMHQLLRMEPKIATQWTVVATTPSTSSNISNALTLGLHYQARIIAVSSHGICHISEETRPFGLPKDHPVPGPPENLHYVSYNRTEGGLLTNTVFWEPPNFPIAISKYLITYHQFSEMLQSEPPSATASTSEGPQQLPAPRAEIPGNEHFRKLRNLMPNSSYIIKIQAVVLLGERQIFGQIASLQIQTLRFSTAAAKTKSTSSSPTVRHLDEQEKISAAVSDVKIHVPFFDNGKLKASLSWNVQDDIRDKTKHFVIRLRSLHCPDVFDQRMNHQETQDYVKPEDSSIQFDSLRFDCAYRAAIWAESIYGNWGEETVITFETPNCHNVTIRGKRRPDCPRFGPQNVNCEVRLLTKTVNADCFWQYRHDDASNISKFLVVAKTHVTNHNQGSSKNAATHLLVNKDARHTVLTDLVPNSKYHVMVRAMGVDGLGPKSHAHFFVPNLPHYQGASRRAAYHSWLKNSSVAAVLNRGVLIITIALAMILTGYALL